MRKLSIRSTPIWNQMRSICVAPESKFPNIPRLFCHCDGEGVLPVLEEIKTRKEIDSSIPSIRSNRLLADYFDNRHFQRILIMLRVQIVQKLAMTNEQNSKSHNNSSLWTESLIILNRISGIYSDWTLVPSMRRWLLYVRNISCTEAQNDQTSYKMPHFRLQSCRKNWQNILSSGIRLQESLPLTASPLLPHPTSPTEQSANHLKRLSNGVAFA